MKQLIIDQAKCTKCKACIGSCPFGAIEIRANEIHINNQCRFCGICQQACTYGALIPEERPQTAADCQEWKNILVWLELADGAIHKASLEVLNLAVSLAPMAKYRVCALIIGANVTAAEKSAGQYPADQIYIYDSSHFQDFSAVGYGIVLSECIRQLRPSIVLAAATAKGRSMLPRAAAAFRTGMTADCTSLMLAADGSLIQVRPAFGGNVMAEIRTPSARPQMATVRPGVCPPPPKGTYSPEIIRCSLSGKHHDPTRMIGREPVLPKPSITAYQILVAVGAGIRSAEEIEPFQRFARQIGAGFACSRRLVELGYVKPEFQIGLSGKTVQPRLLICFGISGSVQFQAGISAAQYIIAVNKDPEAPILKIAHMPVVGDMYQILSNF